MKNQIPTLRWNDGVLFLLDQRKLPHREVVLEFKTVAECHAAIADMIVRGAPLIGFTGLYAMAFAVKESENVQQLVEKATFLKSARPTAVNLAFEIDRLLPSIQSEMNQGVAKDDIFIRVVEFANLQMKILASSNFKMAEISLGELDRKIGKEKYNLLTICNTGYLACGPMGTALGVVAHAHEKGRLNTVFAAETRPYLQGSRLTSYELCSLGIEHKIIVEGAFSYVCQKGLVDAIFIGADRIARNGDTANKIGSSTLAIVAKHYNIPFYVVAPTSSFDLSIEKGELIPIELRDEDEILSLQGRRIAPEGARALNPSFDMTTSSLITGIVCEKGLITPVSTKRVEEIASEFSS